METSCATQYTDDVKWISREKRSMLISIYRLNNNTWNLMEYIFSDKDR